MATRLKTVEYWFPTLGALTDALLTNFTNITLYLPETGTKTFRSAHLEVMADDIITATGGTITEWRLALQLGAAGYTTNTNTNDIIHSGENRSVLLAADFTSYFNTNWTGASMSCDVQVYIDQSTGTTLGMRDLSAKLILTYEYDDTSTTQVKTVWIPLDAPKGALATAKPGAATATIPALDTFCPEASKTYRDWSIIVQGNDSTTATTDYTISMQLDAAGDSVTTNPREAALNSARFFRYCWNKPTFTTNAAHDFFIWGSVARVNHAQIWLVVTYEFDASATTTVLNSLLLPMEFASPMGGTAAADAQRATRKIYIQEPGTITVQQSALMLFWDQAAAVAGLRARVGAASYTVYTDAASVMCGGNALMNRCETALTLTRGYNALQADVYRTDTADFGMNVSSFWMLNYTSSKATDGVGAHNHTVNWGLADYGTVAAASLRTVAATAPVIPEADYFFNAFGINYQYLSNSTGTAAGVGILAERLSAEGGPSWEEIYKDIGHTDAESGLRQCWAQARAFFKRFPGDKGEDRVDIEQARRWRAVLSNNCASYDMLDFVMTYHSIKGTVSGSISGSAGGTVNIGLFRADTNGMPKERLLETTRAGNGAFSFTWYEDTEDVVVCAFETDTYKGMSKTAVMGSGFDVALSGGGGGGNTYSRGRVVNA